MRKGCIFIFLIGLFALGNTDFVCAHAEERDNSRIAVPIQVRARSYRAKKIKITWKKVIGAEGYEIYRIKGGKAIKAADVGAEKSIWLSPATKSCRTYVVRAYRGQEEEREYSDFSYTVSARPYRKNAKRVNAGTVYAKKYQYKMGLYETDTPEIVIEKSRYSKNRKAVVTDTSLRWYSTDESIAVVDGKGVLHSKNRPGKCQIYARAHNGNYTKKMDVSVYDYARPSEFVDLEYIQPEMENFVRQYENDMKEIAAYFENSNKTGHKSTGILKLSEDRMKIVTRMEESEYAPIRQNIWNIVSDYSKDLQIRVTETTVSFDLSSYPYHMELVYRFDNYMPIEESSPFLVAPHWFYLLWRIDI